MTRSAWLLAITLAPVVAACSPSPQAGASNAPGAPPPVERSTPYDDALAAATASVQAAQGRAGADGAAWTAHEALALALVDRAQLTGSYDDYAAADRALGRALAGGGKAGPCLAAARIHATLHRLAQAAAAIAACRARSASPTDDRAELEGLAGDIAFYGGRYDEALRDYRQSLALAESLGGLSRLSLYYARTGAPAEAAALLDRAEHLYHGASARPLAWLALQKAQLALDHGRWDDALAQVLRAQRLMPGWWLADEHVAEIQALRGDLAPALAHYEALAQRTGNPEHMDAIARILLEQHRPADAAAWIARARILHRERLRQLPEAAAGHALDHFLRFEPLERDELLALAQRNLAARPGAEAHLWLARVYLRLGQPSQAAAALRPVLGTAWNTAELHAVAALVLAASHDEPAAEQARRTAVAINPQALRMYAWSSPS